MKLLTFRDDTTSLNIETRLCSEISDQRAKRTRSQICPSGQKWLQVLGDERKSSKLVVQSFMISRKKQDPILAFFVNVTSFGVSKDSNHLTANLRITLRQIATL